MACCCNENDADIAALRRNQARVLWAVLALNAVMFVGEFTAGWLAQSTALLADSLDMLGDSLVYALSLFVIDRGGRELPIRPDFVGKTLSREAHQRVSLQLTEVDGQDAVLIA